MGSIRLRGLRVQHDDHVVLASVDLDVRDGESMAVLGRSGSGKTSLLRTIAGLHTPSAGRVLIGGTDVTHARPGERGIGMVAQGAPLTPTQTVQGNVEFPLQIRGMAPEERQRRSLAELRAFRISWLKDRKPRTLSAGQRQAAATARSVVRVPGAMLLDEPVSNLDAHTRADVLAQIRSIQRGAGTTMLVTTNDHDTARAVGDRVAVLVDARVAQVGTLDEVAAAPSSLGVAELVWTSPPAVLPATTQVRPGLPTLLRTPAGDVPTWAPAAAEGGELSVAVDSTHLTLDDGPSPHGTGLVGVVERVVHLGHRHLVVVRAGDVRLEVPSREPDHEVGVQVHVRVGRALLARPDGSAVTMLGAAA